MGVQWSQRLIPELLRLPGPGFKVRLAHGAFVGVGKILLIGPLVQLPDFAVAYLLLKTNGGSTSRQVLPSSREPDRRSRRRQCREAEETSGRSWRAAWGHSPSASPVSVPDRQSPAWGQVHLLYQFRRLIVLLKHGILNVHLGGVYLDVLP